MLFSLRKHAGLTFLAAAGTTPWQRRHSHPMAIDRSTYQASDGGATFVAASIVNLDGERWRTGDVDRCTYAKTTARVLRWRRGGGTAVEDDDGSGAWRGRRRGHRGGGDVSGAAGARRGGGAAAERPSWRRPYVARRARRHGRTDMMMEQVVEGRLHGEDDAD